MAGNPTLEHETRSRLDQKKRGLRNWRRSGGIVLSLVTVAAAAVAGPPAKELHVQTLRIVVREGKDRIVLTAVPKIPDLTLLDPAGESRWTLDSTDDHKPELKFYEGGKEKGRLTPGIG
ncbi:MAG: hypothetical protein JO284_07540 [Planctomycetaceae bacterium]|nr:hypothetical protein [Planctomycetaceae bacterium]